MDRDLVLAQAVALALARPQVVARDRGLLRHRVAVEPDDLHTVQERAGDRLGDVGGGDEQDLGEVELDVEVVVAERVVLGRVEHLEQGRAGVAAPVGADLVDLVEHDHRVHRPRVAQRAHQAAREGADVRAAVAADLGLVADAAERHADELASGRTRDRLADRGLAGAGRADQREDRAGAPVLADAALDAQLLDRQVLDDAVLDVLEAGVVGVEHLAGVHRVELLVGASSTTARRSASPGRTGSCRPRPTARPSARAARAPCPPARRRPRACRPRRSSCGTPPRSTRSPRPARAGSTPSACAGSTRAAAGRRPRGRPRGSSGAAAARRAARAGSSRRARAAR